jgi:hypothetical protein
MANNYSLFSATIDNLNRDDIEWWKLEMAEQEFAPCLWEVITDEEENPYLWLYSLDGFDADLLANMVQSFLQELRPGDTWWMEWAETCEKPRIGEFGGAWIAVSALEIRYGGTSGAARQAEKEMQEVIDKEG